MNKEVRLATKTRAYKYCGGCNPRYDRKAAVEAIESRLGEILQYAKKEEMYEELYVVCGCPAACVDITDYQAKKVIKITEWNNEGE